MFSQRNNPYCDLLYFRAAKVLLFFHIQAKKKDFFTIFQFIFHIILIIRNIFTFLYTTPPLVICELLLHLIIVLYIFGVLRRLRVYETTSLQDYETTSGCRWCFAYASQTE